ncbi:unnamed protein product, partial [Meganyctiphanes norvegica]
MQKILLLVCIGVLGQHCSWAMSDHVPESACKSMFPAGHEVDPLTTEPPYSLTVPAGDIPTGSEINVVLAGLDPTIMFKGFFVKGFDDSTGTPVGSFVQAPKTIDCEGPASGAHHASPAPKESVVLTWKSPSNYTGTVHFM